MGAVTFQTPACPVCGRVSYLGVDEDDLARWQGGELVQNVWPMMPAGRRELLVSGTHPACWVLLFGRGEDE